MSKKKINLIASLYIILIILLILVIFLIYKDINHIAKYMEKHDLWAKNKNLYDKPSNKKVILYSCLLFFTIPSLFITEIAIHKINKNKDNDENNTKIEVVEEEKIEENEKNED